MPAAEPGVSRLTWPVAAAQVPRITFSSSRSNHSSSTCAGDETRILAAVARLRRPFAARLTVSAKAPGEIRFGSPWR